MISILAELIHLSPYLSLPTSSRYKVWVCRFFKLYNRVLKILYVMQQHKPSGSKWSLLLLTLLASQCLNDEAPIAKCLAYLFHQEICKISFHLKIYFISQYSFKTQTAKICNNIFNPCWTQRTRIIPKSNWPCPLGRTFYATQCKLHSYKTRGVISTMWILKVKGIFKTHPQPLCLPEAG